VNEHWLDQYRAWVYGMGFGWQIGNGLSTYIMTAAVYLTIALAALTGEPITAFALAVLFGTVRGMAVFLGARLTSREALVAFHRRFEQLAQPVRHGVIAVQFAVAAVAAGAAWGWTVPIVAGIAATIAAVAVRNLGSSGERRAHARAHAPAQ
jgi:hypothetical protein